MNFKCGWWHVAYREKELGQIFTDRETPFRVIPNTWRYCAMDPFVFEYQNTTYVFAEVYSIFHQRGLIGYSQYKNEKWTKWKPIIREDWHLSYPYIFRDGDGIYLIPESYQKGEVYAYRATEFPEKWEKAYTLIEHVKYVDTSVFELDGRRYAFTYDIGAEPHKLLLYSMKDRQFVESSAVTVSEDPSVAREGGYPFLYQDTLVRVSQDCKASYGAAVKFSKVCSLSENYEEDEFLRLSPEMIRINHGTHKVLGIHHYTATDRFEVIDLKGRIFHPIELLVRMMRKISEKAYRLVVGK